MGSFVYLMSQSAIDSNSGILFVLSRGALRGRSIIFVGCGRYIYDNTDSIPAGHSGEVKNLEKYEGFREKGSELVKQQS